MLKVLTVSTNFPDRLRPNLGIFVERQTLELAGTAGVDVRVIAPLELSLDPRRRDPQLEALPKAETWKGLHVERPRFWAIPGMPGLKPVTLAARLLPVVRRLRKDFRFDVVAAEFFWPEGPAVMRLARSFGVPFSLKARGDDVLVAGRREYSRPQLLAAAQRAGGLLAVSAALRDGMVALGMDGEKIQVHRTGLDRTLFHPRDKAEARRQLEADGPLLLCVGSLTERKDPSLALRAFSLLEKGTLLVAGGGPEREKLETEARNLGIGHRVRLLGSVPHAGMPDLYNAADALVLTSRREGLPNCIVESLGCGTPVVTTNVQGAAELLNRVEACRIVGRNPAEIAQGIEEVLASSVNRTRLSRSVDDYCWSRNARELVAHYKAVAGQGAKAADNGSEPLA